MKNTLNKTIPATPGDGSKKNIPPARALEQTEPVGEFGNNSETADAGRLQKSVSVGKKGETRMAPPHQVESLRPAKGEMTNG